MRWFRGSGLGRRGSVSVELALVSSFFLIPLTLGAWDGLFALGARYQVNAALHTLYFYAWSNPTTATSSANLNTLLGAINQTSIASIALSDSAPPLITYNCAQSDGSSEAATAITNSNGIVTESCSSGTLAMTVSYTLVGTVGLPFSVPWFANPTILTLAGSVRVQ